MKLIEDGAVLKGEEYCQLRPWHRQLNHMLVSDDDIELLEQQARCDLITTPQNQLLTPAGALDVCDKSDAVAGLGGISGDAQAYANSCLGWRRASACRRVLGALW